MNQPPTMPHKHYFTVKGKTAEDFLQQLASQTFLTDWCYPNPKLPTGKELCDLLVVFDTTAIIWQAKSLKVGKDGNLKQAEVDKNLNQLAGARRQLFDLKTPLMLDNPRRRTEQFDSDTITEVFLVSALLGDTPDFQAAATHIKTHRCHVFTRDFTELVLTELDTIADFCAYLREKERIRDHMGSFVLSGGEKELLACYLLNNRSLARFEGYTSVLLEHGMWDDLQHRPEYQAKRRADQISYVWDGIIERVHMTDSLQYERIARELARPDRCERRLLGECFFDGQLKAHQNASPKGIFRRVVSSGHATFCFLFAGNDIDRGSRHALLENLCFVARGRFPQHRMVLGIATEMAMRPYMSFDYSLLDIPEWGPNQQQEMERLQQATGILTQATSHEREWTEYPELGT